MTITRTVDVAVVGAGLAGLSAADHLVEDGHDVVVLDGRDRVGGRLHTTEVAGVRVDAGATWVAPGHTAVRDLARRFGLDFVPQYDTGKGLISFQGRRRREGLTAMSPWVMADLARIMHRLEKTAADLSASAPWEHPDAARLDSMSFGQWLDQRRALAGTRRFMTIISLVHWGAAPGDVSLFNVLRYIKTLGGLEHMLAVEGGDQQDRLQGTAHTLAENLAQDLGDAVLLGAPVTRITTENDQAIVETAQHRIHARHVIVTAAPQHRAAIDFRPALPEQHYGLSRSWRMGALSKAFVAYDRPFWREQGLSGQAMSDDDTVFLTFDVSPDATGPGILMVFCDARGFDAHSEDERRRRVIDHLAHLYGTQARDLIEYTDFAWGNDTFAAGGPNPAVAPRAWTTFGPYLRQPVGLIHWAGSETAEETSGTMNGAILSGHRAAGEVAAQIKAGDHDKFETLNAAAAVRQ